VLLLFFLVYLIYKMSLIIAGMTKLQDHKLLEKDKASKTINKPVNFKMI
jgi:hypothetical protein